MSTVDISRYQGVVPVSVFQQWRAAGYERVILKIGGGDSGRYEDSRFAQNYANAVTVGFPQIEGYWFNGTTDPAGDAVFAQSIVGPDMLIWWDAESEGSMGHWSPGQVLAAHAAISNPQGVYMSQSVTFEPGWEPVAAILPLWEAAYTGGSRPPVGNGFRVVLWQYTSSGHLPGYGGNLDLDQDLAGVAVLTSTPIPIEETEETMLIIKRTSTGEVGVFGGGFAAADGTGKGRHIFASVSDYNGFKAISDTANGKGQPQAPKLPDLAAVVGVDENGWKVVCNTYGV